MTSAPADLSEVQAYAHDRTGQPWASLGIIHSTPQGGGYHEGEDLLILAGSAPGPQYPDSDYSYTDAPARDLLASGRLAGGNYASAFDFGGGFPRFLEFNAWMKTRMLANDPRTRDIREMIYTLDGRTVRRIDRTGIQGDSGDSSHLSHTHFSFFRDSVGRRNRDDNFLGLLKEYFTGTTPQEGDDMEPQDLIHATITTPNWDGDKRVNGGNPETLEFGIAVGTASQRAYQALRTSEANSRKLDTVLANNAADATRDAALMAAVKALTVATGNDPAPILAAIHAEGETTRQAVLAQHAADRQREADAAQAEADALKR